jgi:hypothetical protein
LVVVNCAQLIGKIRGVHVWIYPDPLGHLVEFFGPEPLLGNRAHSARDDSGIGVLREQAAK